MATKYRNELKYMVSEAHLRLIENNIMTACRLDSHVGENGTYMIRSLYFDDPWDSCYRENEIGVQPRAKYRVRVYDGSLKQITLEEKSKVNDLTRKRGAPLTREQLMQCLAGGPISSGGAPVINKFNLLVLSQCLRPKMVVEYERTPYIYADGNVRITFDRNICAAFNLDTFWEEDLLKRPVLPRGQHILEIKYDSFLPEHIKNLVQIDGMMQTSFSKYYQCRKVEKNENCFGSFVE